MKIRNNMAAMLEQQKTLIPSLPIVHCRHITTPDCPSIQERCERGGEPTVVTVVTAVRDPDEVIAHVPFVVSVSLILKFSLVFSTMQPHEFQYKTPFVVTKEMKLSFENDGFIFVRGLLDAEEQKKIKHALEANETYEKEAFKLDDNEGRKISMVAWRHPGNDVTGILARCERVSRTCEEFLGDEVYHYHAKLIMKNAKTGGQHAWHQDYGYWYQNGNLFPDMMSVFIAVDPCTKENGCLKILQGSHRCGRIDHCLVGGQQGADMERVKQLQKVCPLVYCELNPGDAIFFHSNLLHSSDANTSDMRRWAIIIAYNTLHNNPTVKHHLPQYTKLDIVDDSALKSCINYFDMTGKDFIDPKTAKTLKVDEED